MIARITISILLILSCFNSFGQWGEFEDSENPVVDSVRLDLTKHETVYGQQKIKKEKKGLKKAGDIILFIVGLNVAALGGAAVYGGADESEIGLILVGIPIFAAGAFLFYKKGKKLDSYWERTLLKGTPQEPYSKKYGQEGYLK